MNLRLCVLLSLITAVAIVDVDAVAVAVSHVDAVADAAEVGGPPMVYVGAPPLEDAGAPPPVSVGAFPQGKGETVGPFGVISGADSFDDGVFDGVRSLTVYIDERGVRGISVQYVAKEKFENRTHGSDHGGDQYEFVIAYPEEYVTVINVTQCDDSVTSLLFATSYGLKSSSYGNYMPDSESCKNFVLKPQDDVQKKLVGFLGRSGKRINTLGGHFDLTHCDPKDTVSEMYPRNGYQGEGAFDDGVFDGVKKVTVRGNPLGLTHIRIQYVDCDTFQIREHGRCSDNDTQDEMEIDYPNEYITSLIVYKSIMGLEVVTSYGRNKVFGTLENRSSSSIYVVKPQNGREAKFVGLLGRTLSDGSLVLGGRFHSEDAPSAAKTETCCLWISVLLWVTLFI